MFYLEDGDSSFFWYLAKSPPKYARKSIYMVPIPCMNQISTLSIPTKAQ